ncbi:MAG TPA: TRAP transporter substrate-binding protein [Aliidongia sp.]|nr:TRAP transporter substrate-binding protein [Aliidongia sp.]
MGKARYPEDLTVIATLIALPGDKLLQRSFRIAALALGAIFGLIVQPARPHAEDLPFAHFKVLGSLERTSHYREIEEPFWSRRLYEDSGGRISAEIAPFDKAGVTASEAVQLTRLGVISFLTVQVGLIAAEDPEANASDLPGVSPTIEDMKGATDAWKPVLNRVFGDRYGIDVLAVMGYPAQALFCVAPLASLGDVTGRNIRTSSVQQTDFIDALGARGVLMPLGDTRQALESGTVDCAITGTLTGNLMGLQKVSRYLYDRPISWGLEVVLANGKGWLGLDAKVRSFLVHELAELEAETWKSSAAATFDGIACNAGRPACIGGTEGHMVLVPPSETDSALIHRALIDRLLPKWAERCGPECTADWNRLIGGLVGLTAKAAD